MGKTKAVIVDDHAALRLGLRDYLKHNDIDVVAEGATIAEANLLAQKHKNCIFILDLNLGGEDNGFPLIASYVDKGIKVVVYSMREGLDTVLASYRAGALAFIPKSVELSHLVDAIKMASTGENYYLPGNAEKLFSYITKGAPESPTELLTESELKIFLLTAAGKKPDEVSKEIGFSIGTVHNRLSSIRKKLDCSNLEMYKIAQKHGLIS